MSQLLSEIDIKESKLDRAGNLLDVLLMDRTTGRNIIWGTDSYVHLGAAFAPDQQISPHLITGEYDLLIQPRAAKSLEEQHKRTKEKAEVFTPLHIIEKMNASVDRSGAFKRITDKNWREYVKQIWLEITCGEGPFIVSRYDPTAHTGELIPLEKRVGFLDKKLRTISKYCDNTKDWLTWAKEAFKASYGYDWQGDNVLLARENLLYTLVDFYKDKFGATPSLKIREEFAEIISWNIFQMDGLRYVPPMSVTATAPAPGQRGLFGQQDDVYTKIMDWEKGEVIRFVDLTLLPTVERKG